MTGVLLQSRLSSRRLPAKALLPLGGKNVTEQAMIALRRVPVDVFALLTDRLSRDRLAESAAAQGFEVFVGPLRDVLRRYALAARHFDLKTVIRATGDNPLVSGRLAAAALKKACRKKPDYFAYSQLPLGTGVEVIRAQALFKADRQATLAYDREHVTPYLYNHPLEFNILRLPAPAQCRCPDLRVTLDTQKDYDTLKKVYAALYRGRPIETEELVRRFGGGSDKRNNQP